MASVRTVNRALPATTVRDGKRSKVALDDVVSGSTPMAISANKQRWPMMLVGRGCDRGSSEVTGH